MGKEKVETEKQEAPEVKKWIKKVSKRSKRLDKVEETQKAEEEEGKKGVVYVGHLPYGFEEAGLRKFFEQFGKITKLKMSRSQKVILCLNLFDLDG